MLKTRKDKVIEEQKKTIKHQEEYIEYLKERDKLQSESNAGLRYEIEELNLDFEDIENMIDTYTQSSEMILAKIKKLIHDRKSRN